MNGLDNNKMKLWIDDIRNAPDGTWHVARSVTEAIRCIKYQRDELTEISLDHDISHQVVMGDLSRPYPCPETYAAVAYFIGEVYRDRVIAKEVGVIATCLSVDCPERNGGECRKGRVPKITLHTGNIVGAENMEYILSTYGIHCEIKMSKIANRLEMEL